MKRRHVSLALVAALLTGVAVARADEKTSSPRSASSPRFDALKKLAGDWVELKDGKPTETIVSSIRVTAGGNTVQETLFPGTPHEMVTMYHLDGDDLVLTHYCILGNQPHLRAEPGKNADRFVFKFAGGGNLPSADDKHIDHATITILDRDHFQSEWIACESGKECHKVNLDLVRKHE